jgi:hypothetical protein
MAIPFVTPSMTFGSRTAAKDFIRDNILHAYKLRTRISVGPHDQLLREVLQLHPDAEEKAGPGIDYFYVQETWRLPGKDAVGRNLLAIIAVRSDGTERDWSYHHVIDQPNEVAIVKNALAFSLENGRLRRRDTEFAAGMPPVRCALTGKLIKQKHQADTRHLNPTWSELTEGFAHAHGGWSAIETHSGNGQIFVGRDVDDVILRKQWLAYYDDKARPVYVKNERPERI